MASIDQPLVGDQTLLGSPLERVPGKPVAHSYGLPSMNYGLLSMNYGLFSMNYGLPWSIVACDFRLLGFPGRFFQGQAAQETEDDIQILHQLVYIFLP